MLGIRAGHLFCIFAHNDVVTRMIESVYCRHLVLDILRTACDAKGRIIEVNLMAPHPYRW